MTGTFQVNCHKLDNADADRRIAGLGGSGGGGWYRDIGTLIALIEGGDQFWTVDQSGDSVWIEIHTRNGRKYLKTHSDGIEPNNLLALPRCP